jgi:hypothetical protein
VRVADLTRDIAQRAGSLLTRAKMTSAHAIHAFVVATALEYEVSVIATGDAGDWKRLSAPFDQLSLMQL